MVDENSNVDADNNNHRSETPAYISITAGVKQRVLEARDEEQIQVCPVIPIVSIHLI